MSDRSRWLTTAGGLGAALLLVYHLIHLPAPAREAVHAGSSSAVEAIPDYEWQLARDSWKTPFKDEQPILFVNRSQSSEEWDKLKHFWNETTQKATDPHTGEEVTRKAVVIKVPLGLTSNPPVPPENPMTVGKWALGKRLYFDPILSSDGTVSCAFCHDPKKGFTDQSPFSTGISSHHGTVSAPTIFNTAYLPLHFWDGRALSLEHQSQGPVMNPLEMFSGEGHAWNSVVERLRQKESYVKEFRTVFGTDPTRDAVAKAIATFERTILSGNSLHDRADLVMRARVDEEGTGKYEFKDKDYESVLKAAVAARDVVALEPVELKASADEAQVIEVARRLNNGRALFFGKARCNSCHVGDNFTDNQFHNLGVGVKDGKLPANSQGRFATLGTGQKDESLMGAFKTPTLRHLLGTKPYMHNGSERTLAEVVEFYDRGGNGNEFLDVKMRDIEAEQTYLRARENNQAYKGPEVQLLGPNKKPIVPLKLKLTKKEQEDLVLFLSALQGDRADPIVADRKQQPH